MKDVLVTLAKIFCLAAVIFAVIMLTKQASGTELRPNRSPVHMKTGGHFAAEADKHIALLDAAAGSSDIKEDAPAADDKDAEAETQCGILYALDEDPNTLDAVVNALDALEPDPEEVELLAIAIYCEAGADAISDDTRRMVGDVILNRVADPRYPDTISGVLTQRAQYGRFYWTGVVWPARAQNAGEAHAVDRAREIARQLLTGDHSQLYGEGYIYQAEFRQGSDQVQSDGIWFGR